MSSDLMNDEFEKQRGKSGGFPAALQYILVKSFGEGFELCIRDVESCDNVWDIADTWGIAAFDMVRKSLNAPLSLHFSMRMPSPKDRPRYESLKRRLSYLAAVNPFPILLTIGGLKEGLYTLAELTSRPANEVVRTNFRDRSDQHSPGRLEKDFQAYLYGKGLHDGENDMGVRTNERLALFGYDFIDMKNKGVLVEREFPTGVFSEIVAESARILPTEYIDFVTLNRFNELAIVELKFNAAPLEVIAQLLNYALFFLSYKEKLTPLLNKRLKCSTEGCSIKAYLVSNVFHKRFDSTWTYYNRGIVALQQVVMGYMPH